MALELSAKRVEVLEEGDREYVLGPKISVAPLARIGGGQRPSARTSSRKRRTLPS